MDNGINNKKVFLITFRGEIQEGFERKQVMNNLAKIFHLDPGNPQQAPKIERLFSGQTVIIKKDINRAKAETYIEAISNAGGKAYIKVKIGPPEGIAERRQSLRRKQGERRSTPRLSSIVPDRRKNRGRRETDQLD